MLLSKFLEINGNKPYLTNNELSSHEIDNNYLKFYQFKENWLKISHLNNGKLMFDTDIFIKYTPNITFNELIKEFKERQLAWNSTVFNLDDVNI